MPADPARIYLWSGLIWHGALRAYWVSLVVRITITLELPSLQLVLLGTAMEAALLVSEVPTGVLADRFSRKWSIVIGFLGVGGAQLGAGVVETFPLLVATQICWGVAYTFRSGADTAWITDEVGGPEVVEPLILRLARLQQIVAMVAIGGGAALARFTSLTTSVVLTGIVLIVTGGVLAVIMPENGFSRPGRLERAGAAGTDGRTLEGRSVDGRSTGGVAADSGCAEGSAAGGTRLPGAVTGAVARAMAGMGATLAEGARVTASSPALRLLLVVLVLSGLASEAIDRLDVRRLGDLGLADHDEVVIVAVVAVAEAFVGAGVLWLAQRRLGPGRSPTALAVLLAASAIGIGALGLVAVLPVAAVGLVAQGGLRQAAIPFATAWTNAHATSTARATVHSFVEQANSVGEIGGGVLLGLVAASTTVPTAMTVSLLLMLVAAAVAARGQALMAEPAAATTA